jgi:hypothetical protein
VGHFSYKRCLVSPGVTGLQLHVWTWASDFLCLKRQSLKTPPGDLILLPTYRYGLSPCFLFWETNIKAFLLWGGGLLLRWRISMKDLAALKLAGPYISIPFKQINQPDVKVYYLTFMCRSICFGRLHAHHLVLLWNVVVAALLVVVWSDYDQQRCYHHIPR